MVSNRIWAQIEKTFRTKLESSMVEDPKATQQEDGEESAAIEILEKVDPLFGRLVGLRTAWVCRVKSVEFSLQSAERDRDFLRYVRKADELRDTHQWNSAEYWYWRALRLYPLHHGYIVQYAHMLKEQGKLPDAEYYYRNALALGAPVEDTVIHLRSVIAGVEGPPVIPVPLRHDSSVFDLPPLGTDLEQLSEIFFGHAADRLLDILPVMRRAPTQGVAIEKMLCSVRFGNTNRDLLELLGHRALKGSL